MKDRYTYVIAALDEWDAVEAIKIGSSFNPHERLRQIQTGNHRRLELVAYWSDVDEADLHKQMEPAGMSGEWYYADFPWLALPDFIREKFDYTNGYVYTASPQEVC